MFPPEIPADSDDPYDGAKSTPPKRLRRLHPDEATNRLYGVWLGLLPDLVPEYLTYLQAAQRRTGRVSDLVALDVHSCACISLPRTLVRNGLFPTAPSQPRMAVSIDLLDLYFALFERSADAITALAGALKSLYQRRGFPILNDKGEPIRDPFRRGLGYAVQWYDCLRNQVDTLVESAVDESVQAQGPRRTQPTPDTSKETELRTTGSKLSSGTCSRVLQKRCPACFGGTKFGRNFDSDGGDVHVAIDATFSQRHNLAAGDSPWFHEPKYFISKDAVDAVGARIDAARKTAPREHKSVVPDSALDECEKSFDAADEQKAKTHGAKFDDTGLMALVCRHDIVLFLANVDTPGEQQKYGVALLEHFISFLPSAATVAVFYDIGCVLDRSLHIYNILPQSVVERLVFATSVMHAYGHQWSCQLVYNPRLRAGLGLTEGEGTERVWSKFRKLIGVTRTSGASFFFPFVPACRTNKKLQRSRRIWYLDRHAESVNAIAREDLGSWHRSRLKNGVEARSAKADRELEEANVPLGELREQWQLQRAAQLSLRNHAPARLKKELDKVLGLQADLDEVKKIIAGVQTSIGNDDHNAQAHDLLKQLDKTHSHTIQQVESLYASLNVPDDFPELRDLPLAFVHTLIMARDLKTNIRKRAIGSFFEWDKLDRAAGGRDQALGTKLHQQTRKAIAKRTPALLTAIRKFNSYCDTMKRQYRKKWNIPLPTKLPTELSTLREDPSLLTDVWITPVPSPMPRWLHEPNVRRGIRAMLLKDRCVEERRRLGEEADNLCRWYGNELAAVELAILTPQFARVHFLLEQKKTELLLLQARWRTPLASEIRFTTNTTEAVRIAHQISGIGQAPALTWVHFTFQDEPTDYDGRLDTEDALFDSETILAQDAIAELIGDSDDEDEQGSDELQGDTGDAHGSSTNRILPHPDHTLRPLVFSPLDIDRLRPERWLNDDCVNGCAQLLVLHFGASNAGGNIAILHSFTMAQHRNGTSTDQAVWNSSRTARYWEKDIWIIPVHKPDIQHWELAIVYLKECRIAYFDSLAHRTSWEHDAQVVFALVHRLRRLAHERGLPMQSLDGEEWCAHTVTSDKLQTNGYDCGIWVLACIAALLQGFESVRLSEKDIGRFRTRLLGLLIERTTDEQIQAVVD
ncbi:hypothetical protein C8Q76DRAFT_633393 [Earliella scabrosa]|nr:hypothetical protein C8Q76DRAFT_633393 [Earliella scabrosa]